MSAAKTAVVALGSNLDAPQQQVAAAVAAIAGLALLGTIGTGLSAALKDEKHREAALVTFLVTLSGVAIAGIGSAFWGVVAGSLALSIQNWRRAG